MGNRNNRFLSRGSKYIIRYRLRSTLESILLIDCGIALKKVPVTSNYKALSSVACKLEETAIPVHPIRASSIKQPDRQIRGLYDLKKIIGWAYKKGNWRRGSHTNSQLPHLSYSPLHNRKIKRKYCSFDLFFLTVELACRYQTSMWETGARVRWGAATRERRP